MRSNTQTILCDSDSTVFPPKNANANDSYPPKTQAQSRQIPLVAVPLSFRPPYRLFAFAEYTYAEVPKEMSERGPEV